MTKTVESGSVQQHPVRRIFRRASGTLSLAFVMSLCIVLLMLVPPIYMINVFQKVLSSHSMSTLAGLTFAALVGVGMYVGLDYLRAKLFLLLGGWAGQSLNDGLLEAGLDQSLRGQGNISETLRDIGDIRRFVSGSYIASAMEFLWSPIFFLALFLMHPVYLVVTLAGASLLFLLAIVNELWVRKPTAAAKTAGVRAYSDLGDALRNAEVVAGMGLMPKILDRWRNRNGDILETSTVAEGRSALIRTLGQGIQMIMRVSIIATGAILVIQGQVSPGTLIGAMMVSSRALAPFGAIIAGWREWVNAYAIVTRLDRIISDEAQARPRSTMALPKPAGHLEVDRLVFAPSGSAMPIIRNVSFTVAPGELVAIIGPSAAGKSTLAKLLVGIWAPTAGAVRLDQHDVYTWDRTDFGQYVGFLPQHVELFSGTVAENIGRLADAAPSKVIEAAKRADVHAMIGRFPHGYDTDIGAFGRKLTGGQAQRVGLARALFGNPSLLVLDEPDASLDSEGQRALTSALQDAKARGSTTIVVSHRPALIQLADRVIVMREGAVERIVRPADLNLDDRGVSGVRRAPGTALPSGSAPVSA